ncbi:amino acid adenylation domain-containing protein [Egbenema bharatensis]|uniref:amino acid adenylation domain-containing protein n=1 Tax=Egbenema bharatensis TaxID=3463334 RepID=UPI003A8BCEC0
MIRCNDDFLVLAKECSTLVDLLGCRSRHQPEQVAFVFLQDGETETARWTYRELDCRSRAIAAQLQAQGLTGERALLLYPPGLDYLAAFFGCLYAGVVAVPAYPPRNHRNTPRILAVVNDAKPAIALTTTTIQARVQSLLAEQAGLEQLQWLTTDTLTQAAGSDWQIPPLHSDTLAFSQYTSGSTGTPKGVMLSHRNLLHNAVVTYELMGHSPESVFVSWLPVYHDMGLIGGILQPLYGGFPCILMPPASFLQRPYRWLQAISQYRGTTSGAPNFAYELCIEKITAEQRQSLDLSSWTVAFNGAEPVRSHTLERFAAKFAECGFRSAAFYPCYGMAEATLMVSGGRKAELPIVKTVQKVALERNRIVDTEANLYTQEETHALVGCGQSVPQQQVVIAHPETLTRCASGEVGEIWVSGPSVGQGYWQRPDETAQTFQAYLTDTGEGPFLRTGDLGFLHNGELFVTGRVKDLIIIRGRNLYPQDIELTAEQSHLSLRSGGSAAFVIEVQQEEKLVVVQELEFRQKPDLEEVTAAIRQAIAEEHEVQVYAVVLIKPGTIPKTSSGKIQRRACKAGFLSGDLEIVESSVLESTTVVTQASSLKRSDLLTLPPRESYALLTSYLQEWVTQGLQLSPSQVSLQHALLALGLDSLKVFELQNRIESDLKVDIPISDFFSGLSIAQLATKILTQLATPTADASLPLAKVPRTTETHPLSSTQRQLWFLHQLAPGTPTYNIPLVIHLRGSLNLIALTRSLNEIVKRHESLRTRFMVQAGQPVQVVVPPTALELPIADLQEAPELTQAAQCLSTEFAQQSFDLADQPLFKVLLLRSAPEHHQLLLTLHHIIADGWSVHVLIQELELLYQAFSQEKPSPLSELPIQSIDFAYWQQQQQQGERFQAALAYWQKQLSGKLPVLDLPTDRPRPPIQTFRGAQQSIGLSKSVTDALQHLGQQEGGTLFMTLFAAFTTLLYRYTGQTDILVGSPIANRNRAELESLIGLFVNVLVLRTDLSGEPTFRELLLRVREVALSAYAHQDFPFEKLVEAIQPERDLSYNPLFQVMFIFQNIATALPQQSNLSIQCQETHTGTAKFDLTLIVQEQEQQWVATLEYNTDLFAQETITRMLNHFQTLLTAIAAHPDQTIAKLPLLTASDQQQLLMEWNQTQTIYPEQDQCIHQLFERQVERTPNAIAFAFENEQLTYWELNQRANQLGRYLESLRIAPGMLIGICMERSIEMLVSLFGVLKAGGAYLPLDPTYPPERLAFMLTDSQASVILARQPLAERFSEHIAQVIDLDAVWETIAQQSTRNLQNTVTANHPAYVIYTSGSTGTPKGVVGSHHSILNRCHWMWQSYPFTSGEVACQKTSLNFVDSVWELFGALLQGIPTLLIPDAVVKDPSQLITTLARHQVSRLVLVPSLLKVLLETDPDLQSRLPHLKLMTTSGEPLPVELVQQFRRSLRASTLLNLYGCSEVAADVTAYALQPGDSLPASIPIGHPIANTQIYILDGMGQPVPVGVVGEIYVGGVQLAQGYLRRPELTAERFIPNPFSLESGARLYRTGDLGRYLADGTIEYLGRLDHQVKLRGFRIELGEIESALNQHSAIQQAIVVAILHEKADQKLVSYIVLGSELQSELSNSLQQQDDFKAATISELRRFLQSKLPSYMVPTLFVLLETLPLTPNGKVDRRSLPFPQEIDRPIHEISYQSPQTELEKMIVRLWQDVLQIDRIGINDNFFDLGGHSLTLVQINNQLQVLMQRTIPVVEMFKYPTIKSLASYLNQDKAALFPSQQVLDRAQKQKAAIDRRKQLMGYGRK